LAPDVTVGYYDCLQKQIFFLSDAERL
jgi:hypothetical protein